MAEKYQGDERRRWHLKKEISIGDLLAILLAAGALFGAYSTLDQRIGKLEQLAGFQKQIDVRQDEEALRYQQRIDESLREINRKLDRIIERRP